MIGDSSTETAEKRRDQIRKLGNPKREGKERDSQIAREVDQSIPPSSSTPTLDSIDKPLPL